MTSPLHCALRGPRALVRAALGYLPPETQTHARAAVDEGIAALRSLADGATDATERTIDRIARAISSP